MTQAPQPKAPRIAACLRHEPAHSIALATLTEAARLLDSMHARIAELEAQANLHHPQRLQSLEECRTMNLATIERLNTLNEHQAQHITELERQMAAVGAGGVEPLRKPPCKLHQIAEPQPDLLTDDDAAELILELMAVHSDKDAWHMAIEIHRVLAARYIPHSQQMPIAEIVSAGHDAAEFGERSVRFLSDFQNLEYGTLLYPHPPQDALQMQVPA